MHVKYIRRIVNHGSLRFHHSPSFRFISLHFILVEYVCSIVITPYYTHIHTAAHTSLHMYLQNMYRYGGINHRLSAIDHLNLHMMTGVHIRLFVAWEFHGLMIIPIAKFRKAACIVVRCH